MRDDYFSNESVQYDLHQAYVGIDGGSSNRLVAKVSIQLKQPEPGTMGTFCEAESLELARVMAAAPEMLAVLKRTLPHVKDPMLALQIKDTIDRATLKWDYDLDEYIE